MRTTLLTNRIRSAGAFFSSAYHSYRLAGKIAMSKTASDQVHGGEFLKRRIISRVSWKISENPNLLAMANRSGSIEIRELYFDRIIGDPFPMIASAEVAFKSDKDITTRRMSLV